MSKVGLKTAWNEPFGHFSQVKNQKGLARKQGSKYPRGLPRGYLLPILAGANKRYENIL